MKPEALSVEHRLTRLETLIVGLYVILIGMKLASSVAPGLLSVIGW